MYGFIIAMCATVAAVLVGAVAVFGSVGGLWHAVQALFSADGYQRYTNYCVERYYENVSVG